MTAAILPGPRAAYVPGYMRLIMGGYPPMVSSSATASAGRTRSAAATFSRRWAMDEVPGRGGEGGGRAAAGAGAPGGGEPPRGAATPARTRDCNGAKPPSGKNG